MINFVGFAAVVLSIVAFALAYSRWRSRSAGVRLTALGVLAVAAIPGTLFAVYYLHILPEWSWFYELRAWRGTELLGIFIGAAGGAAASLLPRPLLVLPLFAAIALAVIPYLKPCLGPLPDGIFYEHWRGDACVQDTPSTCGPASVCTILRYFGMEATEKGTARAAFSSIGGTEAWYLARYVRSRGLIAHFDFEPTFSPEAGLPAVVGVRMGGGLGHFIAVLEINGGQVTYADPLSGKSQLPLSQFQKRYEFTGFHMVIHR